MQTDDRVVARLQDVTKSYGGRRVLTDFDLAFEAGSVVALLGPNGAGKSTVAGLVTGRLTADRGAVSLFGRDPRDPAARERLGVMLQAAGLPEALTVAEAVGLHAGYFERRLAVADILGQVGLTDLARRRCDRLSGGEERRVQLAFALAGSPDLLVLDEPTTGFDPEARRTLWQLVRHRAEAGTAVLLATHHLDEAEALADRIVVVVGGRIVADGTPTAIKASVAGTMIRCRTRLQSDALHTLPAVAKVRVQGADAMLLTSDPRATLEALFSADPSLIDLEVTHASLEDALADLTTTLQQEAA